MQQNENLTYALISIRITGGPMQDRKRILQIGLLFTIYNYSLPYFIQAKDGSFKLSFFNLGVMAHVIINLLAR